MQHTPLPPPPILSPWPPPSAGAGSFTHSSTITIDLPDTERKDTGRNETVAGRSLSTAGTQTMTFETFYELEYSGIAKALTITLGDGDLGTEATDEAMVRAFQNWSTVSTYDNPGGWVYRVGLNWARSWHRKLAVKMRFVANQATPLVDDIEIQDPAVLDAVKTLDEPQRAVVVCRMLLDWNVDETAEALKIKPGTVKSRLHRALANLQNTLGEDPR